MRHSKVGRWIGRLALLATLAGALAAGAAMASTSEFEWMAEFEWMRSAQP